MVFWSTTGNSDHFRCFRIILVVLKVLGYFGHFDKMLVILEVVF